VLTYLSSEQLSNVQLSNVQLISERPWAPESVCASELTLWSAMPSSVPASAHVVSAVAGVGVVGASGVEGVLVAQRPLTMQPSRIQASGTTGFTTAAKDNPTASKRIDAVSGVPPRGRPV